jgi:nucleotide-binding universal stress UspA family protein
MIKKRKRSKTSRIQIKQILIPIDGSKNSFRALDMAIFLAKQHKAKLFGISVIDLPTILEYSVLDPVSKRLEKKANLILKRAKLRSFKSRISFKSKIIHGSVGPSLIKFSQRNKYDIIVIGARGLGSFSEIVLGSVSNFIIQKSKIPVVIIK